jgi:GNAT superfamily N-acetyltransferase
VTIEPLQRTHERDAIALLAALRVSLFGVATPRLHAALARDAASGAIDGRVALNGTEVCGLVLAAPSSYWRSALLTHWPLALECAAARLTRHNGVTTPVAPRRAPLLRVRGLPSRTWAEPREAWRIIIVATAEHARGQGVAAQLYRHLMADRSLVARIAVDNTASIRLHESLGWRIYPDGPVLLAVHDRDALGYSADAATG